MVIFTPMAPRRPPMFSWPTQVLLRLLFRLKSMNAFARLSIHRILSILSRLPRFFTIARSKHTLNLGNDLHNKSHDQWAHHDTYTSSVYGSSLPAHETPIHHPLAVIPHNTAPEPYRTSGSSEGQVTLGSQHENLDGTSSITQVSSVTTSVSHISPSGGDQVSAKPMPGLSEVHEHLVWVTPKEYERYERERL
jgi:hypothetical protein